MVIKITCAQIPVPPTVAEEEKKKTVYGYIYNGKQCDMVQMHRWV